MSDRLLGPVHGKPEAWLSPSQLELKETIAGMIDANPTALQGLDPRDRSAIGMLRYAEELCNAIEGRLPPSDPRNYELNISEQSFSLETFAPENAVEGPVCEIPQWQSSPLELARQADEGSSEAYKRYLTAYIRTCEKCECSAYESIINTLKDDAKNGCPHSIAVWERLQEDVNCDLIPFLPPDPRVSPVAISADWERIFDGDTLEGWLVLCHPDDEGKQVWRVEEGAIVLDAPEGMQRKNIWLVTESKYDDFELWMKVQTYPNTAGNSGVLVRGAFSERYRLNGVQMELSPFEPWKNGMLYDSTRGAQRWICPDIPRSDRNSLTQTHAAEGWDWRHADEHDLWNDVRILCDGTNITTTVNGVVTSEFEGAGHLDDELHRLLQVGMSGRIGLQVHAGSSAMQMRFQNILIRPLKK
jgi:hypothetical protein